MSGTLPSEAELLASIAEQAKVSESRVVQVLADNGISLQPPLPAQRRITLRRLYVSGVKAGTHDNSDGPFDLDVRLDTGAWAVASRINSAGKSSVLWALTFALRGESDDTYVRPESFQWFDYIRVDLEVSGVPVSIRLRVEDERSYDVTLLTAESTKHLTQLRRQEDAGPGIRLADSASGPRAVADLLSRFMMERLGLRPLEQFATTSSTPDEDGQRDGGTQLHQWPAYFPMIGLSSASDSILFGKTAVGQLPTRLMQVFLDVPYVAEMMAADATSKASRQVLRHTERRAKADADARDHRWGHLSDRLRQAREELAHLQASVPDIAPLRAAASSASTELTQAERRVADAQLLLEQARRNRIADERTVREASETDAARALFAALNPHSCPRCEQHIDASRRHRENHENICAVCTSPLTLLDGSDEDRQTVIEELRQRLAASRKAEREVAQAVAEGELALSLTRTTERHARAAVDEAHRDEELRQRISEAELEVARLSGAYEVVEQLGDEQTPPADDSEEILAAAKKVLTTVAATVTRELFAELNDEIVTLARELGVANLDSVSLDLAGRLNARKSGDLKKTAFGRFSPGERVRLRIAIVVSMIRVGRRHGINSHPGLLLIDSPADVEIVPGDVKIMLERLLQLGRDVEGIQLLLTTAHEAVWEIFPAGQRIVGSKEKHLF